MLELAHRIDHIKVDEHARSKTFSQRHLSCLVLFSLFLLFLNPRCYNIHGLPVYIYTFNQDSGKLKPNRTIKPKPTRIAFGLQKLDARTHPRLPNLDSYSRKPTTTWLTCGLTLTVISLNLLTNQDYTNMIGDSPSATGAGRPSDPGWPPSHSAVQLVDWASRLPSSPTALCPPLPGYCWCCCFLQLLRLWIWMIHSAAKCLDLDDFGC